MTPVVVRSTFMIRFPRLLWIHPVYSYYPKTYSMHSYLHYSVLDLPIHQTVQHRSEESIRKSEAFGIPEPDRKKQFTEEFRQRSHDKVKKPLLPIIMRTAASAAMLALVIGAVTHLPKQNIPAPSAFPII